MRRVRYLKHSDTQYVSIDKYRLSNGEDVYAFFDIKTKKFKLITAITNELIIEGKASSPHKLKKKIKETLITMGVEFDAKEIRTKRTNR